MLDQLPPEIFGRVLEIATEAWGISFLPPVCLVSSVCHDVVLSTPSLWGILVIDQRSSIPLLTQQLVKAKETDLRITVGRKGVRALGDKHLRKFLPSLVALSHNWVRVDILTNLLSSASWADMGRVEVLRLRFHEDFNRVVSAEKFFQVEARQRNLHSFTAVSLPEQWITPFLTPRITYLELERYGGMFDGNMPASTIHRYLSLTPNLHTLHLHNIYLLPFSGPKEPVFLPHLQNLDLSRVSNLTSLLLDLRAPALRTLTIRDCSVAQMTSIFSQWSQPSYLPTHLQYLELANCLLPQDIPLFIGFLARLPALVRLTLFDTREIGEDLTSMPGARSAETDLFRALASPEGAGPVVGGWLCPSLMHLCIDAPLQIGDLLSVVRARGGTRTIMRGVGVPVSLRSVQGPFCSAGTVDEVAELRSYFVDPEDARCICLACVFGTSVTV
ncbi:hypothetical protein R3P38DRAFT_2715982 [Favolaschia claudopus]|uniref:F-box domain-containing protein n=1 Tax=Favolaschia claudopus TaxID=2862362 RepID=A0AAW0AYW1_9AGAR